MELNNEKKDTLGQTLQKKTFFKSLNSAKSKNKMKSVS